MQTVAPLYPKVFSNNEKSEKHQ